MHANLLKTQKGKPSSMIQSEQKYRKKRKGIYRKMGMVEEAHNVRVVGK